MWLPATLFQSPCATGGSFQHATGPEDGARAGRSPGARPPAGRLTPLRSSRRDQDGSGSRADRRHHQLFRNRQPPSRAPATVGGAHLSRWPALGRLAPPGRRPHERHHRERRACSRRTHRPRRHQGGCARRALVGPPAGVAPGGPMNRQHRRGRRPGHGDRRPGRAPTRNAWGSHPSAPPDHATGARMATHEHPPGAGSPTAGTPSSPDLRCVWVVGRRSLSDGASSA